MAKWQARRLGTSGLFFFRNLAYVPKPEETMSLTCTPQWLDENTWEGFRRAIYFNFVLR
jgi:hypothetical protein